MGRIKKTTQEDRKVTYTDYRLGRIMSISTTLEYWNEAPDPVEVHVTTHWVGGMEEIYYEFTIDGTHLYQLGHEDIIPKGFLRFPDSTYYEFAGPLNVAKKTLTEHGFNLIIKGKNWGNGT